MKPVRIVLQIIGLVVALAGLLWLGQGAGFIRWPASSPMVGDTTWVTMGAGIAVVGLLLILLGRRMR